jgi:putative endonuclease
MPENVVYILRTASGGLYVGSTTDLKRRLSQHARGRTCQTTANDGPVTIVYREAFETFVLARRREAQIKRWTRGKKEALISGDFERLRYLSKRKQTAACDDT